MRTLGCLIAFVVGFVTILALVALADGPSDPAPLPRLEVYESGTTARPWRVRLVAANGDALFTHASTFGTEAAAVARAGEIRTAMGSEVAVRYPSWVAPAPPPSPDPLAARAFDAAVPNGAALADVIARWGPPTYYGRWVPIASDAPWSENSVEKRQAVWNSDDGTYQWGVLYGRDGKATGRGVSWSRLPEVPLPWAR